jgi:phosphoribosyl 1,2-cyclic phosphodiesterase
MTFLSLASSSKGNAYIVSDADTNILLECGLTKKELTKRSPVSLSDLDAVFVTHEHKDHSKCAEQLIKGGLPVYMSYGTAETLGLDLAEIMEEREVIRIGELSVMSFRIWHDGTEPFGYLILDNRTGEKLLFAPDTVNLGYIVPDLTHIAIECNYASDIMDRLDRLPEKIKNRIRRSHMEIETAIRYLHKLDLTHCEAIYLLHMSATCSDEARFLRRFRKEFPGIRIEACKE